MTAWDYIVVGGGTAGAIVAARLSETLAAQVLLLEAGPGIRSAQTPADFRLRNSDFAMDPTRNPEFFWPNLPARRHPSGEPAPYLQGRGLGGGSLVNGLIAIHAMPEDFDEWAMSGAIGWSWQDILPARARCEDDLQFGDEGYHGKGGPMPVYREPEDGWGSVDHAFREAALDIGYGWSPDHNAPGATGLSPMAMMIRDGVRVTTNDGYLEDARSRPNLDVRGDVPVDAVLFDDGRRAMGVRTRTGERLMVADGGEVILSAGAFHSPAILIRSGIGPASTLRELGLEVLSDLPVGQGLQDHARIGVRARISDSAQSSRDDRSSNCVLRYSSGIADAGANDMFMIARGRPVNSNRGGISVMLNRSFSRGRMGFISADPGVEPIVELRLLTDERDRTRLANGLELLREILNRPAMARVFAGSPEVPAEDSLTRLAMDTFHACSTCRMGSPANDRSVVDPEARVLGVEGLRVIDASIMPNVPRSNTNLPTIVLAEHAAAMLIGGRPTATPATGHGAASGPIAS